LKILLLSDLHNEFGSFSRTPIKTGADLVVLAGDIDKGSTGANWAAQTFDAPFLYVAGNHEYYNKISIGSVDRSLSMACRKHGSHYLQNKTVEFDNVRFIGCTLWTDYRLYGDSTFAKLYAGRRMNDYRNIYYNVGTVFNPDIAADLFDKSLGYLIKQLCKPFDGKTVVVTHHAPSEQSINMYHRGMELTPAYASNLEYVMNDYKIDFWFHGHTHESADYQCYNTRVVSNPRGYYRYEENKNFNPNLIIEV
jgi:predicted phosphodiesterase